MITNNFDIDNWHSHTKFIKKSYNRTENVELYLNLLAEEETELALAINQYYIEKLTREERPSLQNIFKEAIDVYFVLRGLALMMGVSVDDAIEEVTNSNWSKYTYTNGVLTAEVESGKIKKGSNYQKPDLSFVDDWS